MGCEKLFAQAAVRPFTSELVGKVCAPVFPSRQSQKTVCSWSNYMFQTGTNGIGWVAVDPCVSRDGGTTKRPVTFTDSTYAGNTASTFTNSSYTAGINGGNLAGPYSLADCTSSVLTSTLQGRVVTAGFRFRYVGMEMYRGGSVWLVYSQNQRNLEAETLGNTFTRAYRRYPVTREWQYATIAPIHTDDWEFVPGHEGGVNTIVCPWTNRSEPGLLAALVFSAASSQGNTWEVEYIQHVEYAGSSTVNLASPSHVGRPEIVNAVLNAATTASTVPNPEISFGAQMLNNITNQELVPQAISGLREAILEVIGSSKLSAPLEGMARVSLGPLA